MTYFKHFKTLNPADPNHVPAPSLNRVFSLVASRTRPNEATTTEKGRYPFNFCRTGIFGKRGQPPEVYHNFRNSLIETVSSISFPSRNFRFFGVSNG